MPRQFSLFLILIVCLLSLARPTATHPGNPRCHRAGQRTNAPCRLGYVGRIVRRPAAGRLSEVPCRHPCGSRRGRDVYRTDKRLEKTAHLPRCHRAVESTRVRTDPAGLQFIPTLFMKAQYEFLGSSSFPVPLGAKESTRWQAWLTSRQRSVGCSGSTCPRRSKDWTFPLG